MRFLSLAALLLAAASASAQTLHLIPQPRETRPAGTLSLANGLRIECQQPCDSEDLFAIDDFKAALAARNIPITTVASAPHIFIARFTTPLGRQTYTEALPPNSAAVTTMPPDMAAEGYAIVPDRNGSQPAGLAVTATTANGIFYALQTLKQLIVNDGPAATLNLATIRDWPAMRYRGLHDDLSRGPVPTLDFQKKLIRTIAAYKANLYSPYFEHTQQYASNPLPAPPGGSISANDARELVAYARQFHITIVPEQEAFGHLRHVLISEQYQQLAETPHGTVLAPGQPGSLTLINQWFTELSRLYPGPFLHIGADETVDLGTGQSKPAVDRGGLGKVYLDFIQQIDTTLRPLHRRLLFWGDVAQDSPDLLKAMPAQFKQDTIAIGWQYNPNPKGFAEYLKPFLNAGFETWVAPGINNWNRIYPNNTYALQNIQQFTRDGQRMGATGQLNTIWYDDGEALASNNFYGILFGAAAAWQKGESSIPDFEQSFAQVFHGDATGNLNQAQLELMAAHDLLKASAFKGDGSDLLFWADPFAPDQQKNFAALRPLLPELRLHAERALTLIAATRAMYTPQGIEPLMFSPEIAAGIINTARSQGARPSPGGPSFAPYAKGGVSSGTTYDPANTLPSNPTTLHEPDAIDALELGARKFDFIGLKFQLADEIADSYARAQSNATLPPAVLRKTHPGVLSLLSDINGVNGRIQDIKDGYALLRDLYAQLWLRTNRPYALRNVLAHYDYTINLWLARMDKARSAQRQWENTRTLPSASDAGIPTPTHP